MVFTILVCKQQCKALYGNVLNHADFPKLQFSTDIPQARNPQVTIKVFAYLVYNDPVSVNVVLDPCVHPNVSFAVSMIIELTNY